MSNTSLLGSFGGQAGDALMFRNKVINGAMEICQRYAVNTNVTLGAPAYVVDRFVAREATPASANAQWSTVAPDGFANSLAYLITATGTPTTNDIAGIEHKIEGLNVVDLAWGTAAAKPVALSFWARSSVTGTYGGLVTNGAETRAYGYTYSISAANTWEYKTVVIPGDTSGTWLKDNGIGLRITWDMGSGSGKRVAGGSWSTISNFEFGVNSTVILGQTASASFYITGVQLEAETATPFERRPYSVELGMCQRYYEKIPYGAHFVTARSNGGNPTIAVSLPQVLDKRTTAPSIQVTGGLVDLADLSTRTISAQTQVYGDGYVALNISSVITGNIPVSCYLNTIQINAEL